MVKLFHRKFSKRLKKKTQINIKLSRVLRYSAFLRYFIMLFPKIHINFTLYCCFCGVGYDIMIVDKKESGRVFLDKKDEQSFFSTQKDYESRINAEKNDKNNIEESDFANLSEKYSKYVDYDENQQEEESEASPEKEGVDMTKKSAGSFFKKNNYKNLKILLISIIVAIIVIFGAVVAYLFHVTNGADYGDDGIDYNGDEILEEEDVNLSAMGDVTDAGSLNDFLYSWANNNGDLMYSKNVLNVLLCGVDTETGSASGGRADAIMLVSINKKTKKITLSSFFRDSYIYMNIPKQSGGADGRYEKINAAYSKGGPATLIDTIEKNFKVQIDEYIAVDFASFKKLIDALGGVTVDVKQNEAMFIRRTSRQTNFPYGDDVKLNGTQALIYSRIRKLDSDVNRTERQRKIIKALMTSAKSASTGQLVNAYKQTAEFIRTGYTQSEIISLIASAVTQNWMKYEINEITLPEVEGVEMASAYVNTSSARNQWVWIVDYPLCAQKLQKAIYGESNIILDADRVSALDYTNAKRPSSNSSGSNTSSGNNSSTTTTTTQPSSGEYTQPTQSTAVTGEEVSSTTSTTDSFELPTLPNLGDILNPKPDTTENQETTEDNQDSNEQGE